MVGLAAVCFCLNPIVGSKYDLGSRIILYIHITVLRAQLFGVGSVRVGNHVHQMVVGDFLVEGQCFQVLLVGVYEIRTTTCLLLLYYLQYLN